MKGYETLIGDGALEVIRTPDIWLRRPTLYPAELRTHNETVVAK